MTVHESSELVQSITNQVHLNKVQELVFRESWTGKSYQEIATISGYEVSYLTDVGCRLWQLLSQNLGVKVTKSNFQTVLKQQKWTKEKSFINLSTVKRVDWGDAVDVAAFYGRIAELNALEQWILEDNCRLVVLLGMGGVGKTSLAAKLTEQIQNQFEYTIWRSLRNAPPFKTLISELVMFLAGEKQINLPKNIDAQISSLMEYLCQHRCLLILDNAESILCEGKLAGSYRPSYQGYGQLLRQMSEQRHHSCLILTSREKPVGLAAKEGKTAPIRLHQMTGLGYAEVKQLLKDKGLVQIGDEFKKLVEQYTGNPLALNIAANTIHYLFNSDISGFLQQDTFIFGEIWTLLEQQFNRLSSLEQQVMYWMAKAHPHRVQLVDLLKNIPSYSQREVLDAINSLQQRSLIEADSSSYVQHYIILEYMLEKAKESQNTVASPSKPSTFKGWLVQKD